MRPVGQLQRTQWQKGAPRGTGLQHKGFPGGALEPGGIPGCRWHRQFPHPPCLSFSSGLTHTALGREICEAHLTDEETENVAGSPCLKLLKLLARLRGPCLCDLGPTFFYHQPAAGPAFDKIPTATQNRDPSVGVNSL